MAPLFATPRHVDLPSSPSKKHRRTKSNFLNPFAHAPLNHPTPTYHAHNTEPSQHHAAPLHLPVLILQTPFPVLDNTSKPNACIKTSQYLADDPMSSAGDDFIRPTNHGRILPKQISIDNLFSAKSKLSKSTSDIAHTPTTLSESNSSPAIHEAPSSHANNFPSIRSLCTKFSISLRPVTRALPPDGRTRKESQARRHLRQASVTAKRLISWAGDPENDEGRNADSEKRKDRKLSFGSVGIASARSVQTPKEISCRIESAGYNKKDPSSPYQHIQAGVNLCPASGSTALTGQSLLRPQENTSLSIPDFEACSSDEPLHRLQDESAVKVPPSERSLPMEKVHLGNNKPREEANTLDPPVVGSSGLPAGTWPTDQKDLACDALVIAIRNDLSGTNNEAVVKSSLREKSALFPRFAMNAMPVQSEERSPFTYPDEDEVGSLAAAGETYIVSGDPLVTGLTEKVAAVGLIEDKSLFDTVEEQEGRGWSSTTNAKSRSSSQSAVGIADTAQSTTRVAHVGRNVSSPENTNIRLSLDTQGRRIERQETLAAAPTRPQRSTRLADGLDISARSQPASVLAVPSNHVERFSTAGGAAELPREPLASDKSVHHTLYGRDLLNPARRQVSVDCPRPARSSCDSRDTNSSSPSSDNKSSFTHDDDTIERWQNPRQSSVAQGPCSPYLADNRRCVFPPSTESDIASFRSGDTGRSSSPRYAFQCLSAPQTRQGSIMTSTSVATLRSKHALEKDSLIQALMLARNEIKMLREENNGLRELVADGIMEREELKACLSDLRDEVERLQKLCAAEASDDGTVALPRDVRVEGRLLWTTRPFADWRLETSISSRQKHSSVSSSIFNCPAPEDMSMLVNAQMDIDNIFCSTPAPLQRSRSGVARFTISDDNDRSPTTLRSKFPNIGKRHPVPGPFQNKSSLGSTTATDISNILSFAESSFNESEAGVSWVLKLSEDDEAHLDDI